MPSLACGLVQESVISVLCKRTEKKTLQLRKYCCTVSEVELLPNEKPNSNISISILNRCASRIKRHSSNTKRPVKLLKTTPWTLKRAIAIDDLGTKKCLYRHSWHLLCLNRILEISWLPRRFISFVCTLSSVWLDRLVSIWWKCYGFFQSQSRFRKPCNCSADSKDCEWWKVSR